MGGDSSKHTGGDFNQAQKDRAVNQQTEDLPLIPFDKKQSITDELTRLLKNSIWLANFKRAYRGYLRRKPERTQQGTMLKIHHSSLADADALGYGRRKSMVEVIDVLLSGQIFQGRQVFIPPGSKAFRKFLMLAFQFGACIKKCF